MHLPGVPNPSTGRNDYDLPLAFFDVNIDDGSGSETQSDRITTDDVVTWSRPSSPEVSTNRNPPTKAMTMKIQIHFAALRICCSTGASSWANWTKKKAFLEPGKLFVICV